MSFFINKIDQVKKMFLNQETKEPENPVKKTPNTIEIKTDYDLDKNDIQESIQHRLSYFDDNEELYNEDINDEDEDVYDSAPYTFNNLYTEDVSEYHYISDRLNRTFGSCMDFDSTKYQIHFCIFKINYAVLVLFFSS
jgi:hypothetical protein